MAFIIETYSVLFSLLPLVFFIGALIKWFLYSSSSKLLQNNSLPSPRKLPIIGNLHQLGSLPHRSLQSLSKKYGPLMLLHFGSKPVLVVSSAEAASQIMKTHDLVFADRPKTFAQKLCYNSKDMTFAHYGEYWRQMKSICVLQLLSKQRVRSFRRVREEETSLMVENIKKKCLSSSSKSNSSSSALINLSDVCMSLANDIICRAALGKKFGDEENGKKAKNSIFELIQLLGVFDVGIYIPWLGWINRFNGLNAKAERTLKAFDEFIEGVIQEHEINYTNKDTTDQKTAPDFVDILLQIQRENRSLSGFPIERDSVKALTMVRITTGAPDLSFHHVIFF